MKSDRAKSMSVLARINNFAKDKAISPQHALQSFFAERFLARIEQSRYVKNLAIKGGTLMSSILGISQRTTMDVDATVIGIPVDEETVKKIVAEVAATDVNDGIRFDVDLATPGAITKDDDYGGFSIRNFYQLATPPPCIASGNVIVPMPRMHREFRSIQH